MEINYKQRFEDRRAINKMLGSDIVKRYFFNEKKLMQLY